MAENEQQMEHVKARDFQPEVDVIDVFEDSVNLNKNNVKKELAQHEQQSVEHVQQTAEVEVIGINSDDDTTNKRIFAKQVQQSDVQHNYKTRTKSLKKLAFSATCFSEDLHGITNLIRNETELMSWTNIQSYKMLDGIVQCLDLVCHRKERMRIRMNSKLLVTMVFIKFKLNLIFLIISFVFCRT